MNENIAEQPAVPVDKIPITVTIVGGYAFVFAAMFLLYGGVNVVLSFLDHSYDDLAQPIIFLVMGLIFLAPAIGFRELKKWGYWGLVGINGLVVLLALIGFQQYENLVVLVFSGAALYMLLSPTTKKWMEKHY